MRRATTLFLLACLVTSGFTPVSGLAQPAPETTATASNLDAPTAAAADASANNSTTLTLLTYNDIQTAAAKDGNLPRLVTLIERRRAAHENPVVVAGAGDQISPHALSPVSKWRSPVAVLNGVNPDADVVGNHEFDYGLGEVSNVTAASEFPWLATNVVNKSTGESFDGTENYTIVERDGVRVGFVGVIDREATYGKTNINFSERGLVVQDFREVGPETAKYLKEEKDVDVVVALAHTGVPQAKEMAEADTGGYVDVIAVGDDEIKYPPQETSDTVITEGVARATYLGELNLTVEDGEVTAWNGRLVDVSDDVPRNETASRTIEEYRSAVNLDSTVGYSETPLNATFEANYHRETGYGNLVTDAMRNETGADVAITNAGGIRSDSVYGPGNVTGGDVFNTLPFANTLVTVRLSGSELRETLASQVVTADSEAGKQYGAEISQQVSGVRFEWVPRENADPKIRDVYVDTAGPTGESDWERLDDDGTYNVTVNSYMAGAGDGYPLSDAPRVSTTDKLLSTVVTDYVQSQTTVAPESEGRMWRVTTGVDDANVRVDGDGKVVLRLDAPADYDRSVPGTFSLVPKRPGAEAVAAERVVYDESEGTLVVRFDDAALASMVEDEAADAGDDAVELDLYGGYESSALDRAYWPYSRLNADVTASVAESPCTRRNTDESDAANATTGDATGLSSSAPA